MEEQLLASQIQKIEDFAVIWLESGANSYEVWVDGTRIARWSNNGSTETHLLTAEIKVNSTKIGEFRLSGLKSPAAEARLNAEAKLIADYAILERDLDGLASELINTRDQLLAVYNLSRANRDNLDLGQTLDSLVFEAASLLKAEGAFLFIKMRDGTEHLHEYPIPMLDGSQRDKLLSRFGENNMQYLCLNNDESDLPDHMRNILLVPIPVRDATQSVLGVINKTGGQYLTPDIKLATTIADFAGSYIEKLLLFQISVEQARLLAEMERAQEVQIRLSPTNNLTIPDLDVWAASRPASHVGGDFYDFNSDLDDSFTFFIGDVSGKGIPAALLVAMTRASLQTEMKSFNEYSPSKILAYSNQKLYEDFNKVGMFATVFIAQYDSQSHQLCFGNAGHSPVVYSPSGGDSYLLKADSMPLGIMSTRDSQDQCLIFRKGDVVVIGTDGLVDAQNEDKMRYGYDRFRTVVESLAHKTPREVGEGLIAAVDEFSAGNYQGDDQTLVVLKRVE